MFLLVNSIRVCCASVYTHNPGDGWFSQGALIGLLNVAPVPYSNVRVEASLQTTLGRQQGV